MQRKVAMEQDFITSGHAAALARATSCFSAAALVSNKIAGIDYYLFLKKLLANWNYRKTVLPDILCNLADRIFTADEVTVSFTGSAEDRERFWAAGGTLGLEEQGHNVCEHRLEMPSCEVKREGFAIPSDVSYVVRASAPVDIDKGNLGTWAVASSALSLDYLWNRVRVKGGAYGVGFRVSVDGLRRFWSFRDPGVSSTLASYDQASAWLGGWQPTDDELTGYIVSSVASIDAPVKPRQLARRQDIDLFNNRALDWRNTMREQVLSVSAADVRALAPAIAPGASPEAVCVFGPKAALDASDANLEVTELVGKE
jgi:Zn-dependent M16 (insulinase) family peptidase